MFLNDMVELFGSSREPRPLIAVSASPRTFSHISSTTSQPRLLLFFEHINTENASTAPDTTMPPRKSAGPTAPVRRSARLASREPSAEPAAPPPPGLLSPFSLSPLYECPLPDDSQPLNQLFVYPRALQQPRKGHHLSTSRRPSPEFWLSDRYTDTPSCSG